MILNFNIKIVRFHRFYANMGVYRCILHLYKQDGVHSAKADPCRYTLQCKAKPRPTGNVLHRRAKPNHFNCGTKT